MSKFGLYSNKSTSSISFESHLEGLDEEKEAIDLLDKIGEIKGLLINLYM